MKTAIAGCLTLLILGGMAVKPASAMPAAWFDDGSGSGADASGCGSGSRILCRTDTTVTCIAWSPIGPGGISTCQTTVTVTKNYYLP